MGQRRIPTKERKVLFLNVSSIFHYHVHRGQGTLSEGKTNMIQDAFGAWLGIHYEEEEAMTNLDLAIKGREK